MEWAPVATNKELCVSDGRKTLERPGTPVATNKERRPSGARERRGRETVSAPGKRESAGKVPIYREAQVRQDSESRWRRRTPSELIHIGGDFA